jgi:threonine dehydratase
VTTVHDAAAAPAALPTLEDVQAAAERIRGIALRTPLLPFRERDFIKPESLQPTGSFKIRGAYNALSQLTREERERGVVAHSSGNHAQAVARAGRLLGIRVVVVMPDNAPSIKVEGVRKDGGEIVFVGPHNSERVARAHEMADTEGLNLISSADDARIVCGQGTIGLELAEQLDEEGVASPPVVLVPCGLGGLSAGISLAVKALRPDAQVIGVEPEIAADTRDSLAHSELTPWPAEKTSSTIADGLRAEAPARIPFEIQKRYLDRVLTVSEEQIIEAIRVAAREARLVLEPSGAVTLAALLHHRSDLPDDPVVAIASGSNVDPQRYVEFLAAT